MPSERPQDRSAAGGIEASYAAVPVSVRRVRRACAALAERFGAPPSRVDDVALAVSEAVTNVVRHAYPPPRDLGEVHVSAGRDDEGALRVVVADDGVGLHASPNTGGLGRGLAIMDELSDELRVLSPPGAGTSVQLTFRLRRR